MTPSATLLMTESLRLFLSTTALFLLIGGLAILFLIVALFLLQSLIPSSAVPEPLPAGKGKRRLRAYGGEASATPSSPSKTPATVRLWRRHADDRSPMARIDLVLDRLVLENGFEPRILRRLANGFHVRLLRCHDCARTGTSPRVRDSGSCPDGQARIAAACQSVFGKTVRVQEIACRIEGAPMCDYEVIR